MHTGATQLTRVLIATALIALTAPIAQAANRSHNSEQAALTAAWQSYRGLPGGPQAQTTLNSQQAYTAAWPSYQGLPGGPLAKVDPLAVSYLRARGLSPSQITAWTVGSCSHAVKPAACFAPSQNAAPTSTRANVDPLAVSYLRSLGLTPSEVNDWTMGSCSHAAKPAACFAPFARTADATQSGASGSFDWGDAGIGAAATLGLVLLAAALGAALVSARNQRRQPRRA